MMTIIEILATAVGLLIVAVIFLAHALDTLTTRVYRLENRKDR